MTEAKLEKEREALEKEKRESAEVARVEAYRSVQIGKCYKCGKPLFWDLNNPEEVWTLERGIRKARCFHKACETTTPRHGPVRRAIQKEKVRTAIR